MKSFFRNAAFALTVFALGTSVVKPVFTKSSPWTSSTSVSVVPMCPTSSPDGCGIYK